MVRGFLSEDVGEELEGANSKPFTPNKKAHCKRWENPKTKVPYVYFNDFPFAERREKIRAFSRENFIVIEPEKYAEKIMRWIETETDNEFPVWDDLWHLAEY